MVNIKFSGSAIFKCLPQIEGSTANLYNPILICHLANMHKEEMLAFTFWLIMLLSFNITLLVMQTLYGCYLIM